ncbi:triphosphoribosyl-dephospho-CoA synthase CitG [Otariodibacter sp.]|uniref:triphosphoribosyl-dephospho-CoA synthase CitG n=1 Tax=Otariodibacter sp. TaxID=3030919 RepID=UPI0026362F9F|nr:triphosphoribosyl-dephospho-CoA synthase CitG [Otariodibacter sp.]
MILNKFNKNFSKIGKEISLEQLLEARDNRAEFQRNIIRKYNKTLLSLTLLSVGNIKKNELLDYIFDKSIEALTLLFEKLDIKPEKIFIRQLITGHEAFFVVPISARDLKLATIKLEDSSEFSRLWDIDIVDSNGYILSRGDFKIPPRKCLICDETAKICAKLRKHSICEIYNEIEIRAKRYFFAEKIGELAYLALLEEARLTPKPGLVDRLNTGAHSDMSLITFEKSAQALRPFFTLFVYKGIETSNSVSDDEFLKVIRPIGIEAEKAMFMATDGVNTHKGSIFTLGLVCAAIGRTFTYQEDIISIKNICELIKKFTVNLTKELSNNSNSIIETAGIRIFRKFGFTGARGEAENGFPLVLDVIEKLKTYQKLDKEHYLKLSLLSLIATNNDTNVINRGGLEGLKFMQLYASKLLADSKTYNNHNFLNKCLIEFDSICIEKNLSPGGSADLLALIIFFQSLRGH